MRSIQAITNADGRLEVFGINSAKDLVHYVQTDIANNTWNDAERVWEGVSGFEVDTWQDGRINVVLKSTSGVIYETHQKAPNVLSSRDWQGGATGTNPDTSYLIGDYTLCKDLKGCLHVFYSMGRGSNVYWMRQKAPNTPIDFNAVSTPGHMINVEAAVDAAGKVQVWGAPNTGAYSGGKAPGLVSIVQKDDNTFVAGDSINWPGDYRQLQLVKNGVGCLHLFAINEKGEVIQWVQKEPGSKWNENDGGNTYSSTTYYSVNCGADGRVNMFGYIPNDGKMYLGYGWGDGRWGIGWSTNKGKFFDTDMTGDYFWSLPNYAGFTTLVVLDNNGRLVMASNTIKGDGDTGGDWHLKNVETSKTLAKGTGSLKEHDPALIPGSIGKKDGKPDLLAPLDEAFKVAGTVGHLSSRLKETAEEMGGKTLFDIHLEKDHFENLLDQHIRVEKELLSDAGKGVHAMVDWVGDEIDHLLTFGGEKFNPINDGEFDRSTAEAGLMENFIDVVLNTNKLVNHLGIDFPLIADNFVEDVLPLMKHLPDATIKHLGDHLPKLDWETVDTMLEWNWDNGIGNVRHDVVWGMAIHLAGMRIYKNFLNIILKGLPCKIDFGTNVHIAASLQGGLAVSADVGIGFGAGLDFDIPIIGGGVEADGGAGNISLFDLQGVTLNFAEIIFGPVAVGIDFLMEMESTAIKLIKEHWKKGGQ